MFFQGMATRIHAKKKRQSELPSSADDPRGVTFVPPQYWWNWIRVKLHAAMNFFVPIGYEDETGFHSGQLPAADSQKNDKDVESSI